MLRYRTGKTEDLDAVCSLVEAAKAYMRSQGIDQWDDLYPIREDFENDMEQNTLYVVLEEDTLAAVYAISEECEDAYLTCDWENEKPCVIHRLCVSPDYQNRGIGRLVLDRIEKQLFEKGYDSVRLDVFSENPYALRLYEKNGYCRRGHADWRKGRFFLMEKKLT